MEEEWRKVDQFPDFEVSNLGRVRRWTSPTKDQRRLAEPVLSPTAPVCGYPAVNVSRGRTRKSVFVHVLVLEAFRGPRPPGMVTRHFPDPTKTNCRLDNLQWGTRAENEHDKIAQGVMTRERLAEIANRNRAKIRPENHTRGANHWSAKLNPAKAANVRFLVAFGSTRRQCAEWFDISRNRIDAVVHGRHWTA